jgi:hypothetical protein
VLLMTQASRRQRFFVITVLAGELPAGSRARS